MTNISDRIAILIKEKGISTRALEQAIGCSNGVISRCISKGTDISSLWVSKIIEIHNDINPTWLLTGKGDIYYNTSSTANPNTTKGIEIWIHSSGSERSYAAADDILSNLEAVGITTNRGVRIGTQGDSDDDYAVIRDTDMTSMIVEMGFMTNQDDLDYFNENLENYAKAISNGVVQWLNDYVQ